MLTTGGRWLWSERQTCSRAMLSSSGIYQRFLLNWLRSSSRHMPSILLLIAGNYPIVALLLEGKDVGAIFTELTGMTSKNGKPYMATLTEVQAVIRDTLKQRLQAA